MGFFLAVGVAEARLTLRLRVLGLAKMRGRFRSRQSVHLARAPRDQRGSNDPLWTPPETGFSESSEPRRFAPRVQSQNGDTTRRNPMFLLRLFGLFLLR